MEDQKKVVENAKAKKDLAALLKEANKLFDKKSPKIRWLRFEKGLSRRETADLLHIRYQHVRNVELMPLKRDMQ